MSCIFHLMVVGAAFSGLFLMISDLGPEHGVRNLSSSDNLFPVTAAAALQRSLHILCPHTQSPVLLLGLDYLRKLDG